MEFKAFFVSPAYMLYIKSILKYNYYMLKIKSVAEGSIGQEIGLKAGDKILNFNNDFKADILDYIYYDATEFFSLTIQSDKKVKEFDIEKYPDEQLGLDFDESAELKANKCQNKCLFCFVDQLPKKMRDTLYIKDDDYRLSFVTGNYVTLTNLSDYDIKRITQRLFSPLYISVHATDPQIRCDLLGNKKAGNILELIKTFAAAGIVMHCQVVLCPNINDGEVLKKTIEDLKSFYPYVKSLAIVPVGMTKHRQGLSEIAQVSKEKAMQTINICNNYPNFVYCSDEFYLKANVLLPSFESYGEFEQIENGVGLIRKFEQEFYQAFSEVKPLQRQVLVITGKSAFEFIKDLTEKYKEKYGIKTIETKCINNSFFGDSITVSGLISGSDIVNELKDSAKGKEVILPRCMLKEFESVFLDGMDIISLEKQLLADIKVCDVYGYSFFDALTGEI